MSVARLQKHYRKTGLGTKWGWSIVDRSVDGARIWAVLSGLRPGVSAIAVRPHPHEEGKFTVDLLPSIGPWECYVDGPFDAPKLAAKAAVKQYRQEEVKRAGY